MIVFFSFPYTHEIFLNAASGVGSGAASTADIPGSGYGKSHAPVRFLFITFYTFSFS